MLTRLEKLLIVFITVQSVSMIVSILSILMKVF